MRAEFVAEFVDAGALVMAGDADEVEGTPNPVPGLGATAEPVPEGDEPVKAGLAGSAVVVLGNVLSVSRFTSGNSCTDRLGDRSCPVAALVTPDVPATSPPRAKLGAGVC